MSRRMIAVIVAVLTLALVAPFGRAQDDTPTALINAALADLSNRAGIQLTLNDLTSWRWELNQYPDASLGCPQEGQVYAQALTMGYRIIFVYAGATFDYRATESGSNLFLCSGPATMPSVQPTAAPTPVPAEPAATATQVGRAVCENAMNTRLDIGQEARVRPGGLPVNLREQATTSSPRVDQIAPGDTFAIIGGPACAENMVWWNVQYDAVTGWAAEGAGGTYWLEPTGTAVTVTSVPATPQSPAVAPASTPAISEAVIVHALPEGFRREITRENVAQVARQLEFPVAETVTGVAWSPDRVLLAVTTQSGLRLYNMIAFRNPPRVLSVPDGPTTSAAFNAEGTLIASGHNDAQVRIWDTSTGGLRALLRGHTEPVWAVAYHPDGVTLASGSGNPGTGDDSTVRLWDIATGTEIATLTGHSGAVIALAFNPDGTLLASASLDETIRFWDIAEASPGTVLTNHNSPVRDIAFSPDGALLASVGDDGQIVLWDIAAGEARSIETGTALRAVAFNLDGTLLITGNSGEDETTEAGFVHLWDIETETVIATLPPHDAPDDVVIASLAIDDLGVSLAEALTRENDGVVRVWGIVE